MIARSAALGDGSRLAIRLHRAINVLDRFPLSVLQLMLRVAIAAVFWSSGLTKIASWQTTIALFRDEYMVPLLPPEIAAVMSATFELSCSALVVVGLATRLATLPLLAMTFVIEVFVYPEYWTMHLMWASVLLFLLTKGPGVFSLDHYAGRLLRAKGSSYSPAVLGEDLHGMVMGPDCRGTPLALEGVERPASSGCAQY